MPERNDIARLEHAPGLLDQIGVKKLKRRDDPACAAFATLRRDRKALGLPATALIDDNEHKIGAAAAAVNCDPAEAHCRLAR